MSSGAMSSACSEALWLHGLPSELDFTQTLPTPLHANNAGAIQMRLIRLFHEYTKHIDVDCDFIYD